MKLSRIFTLLVLLAGSSSCAMMMNEKTDQVSINSNPPGADIFIEGRSYGKTPATITIEAKNQTVVLTKEGHGSAQLQLEAWATVKNGACSADMLGAMLILPLYSAMWSGKCNEFKEKQYFVTIPRTASAMNSSSMLGVGRNPADMINYYYQSTTTSNGQILDPAGQQYPGQYREQHNRR
jgi:hypothetical protein